MHDENAVVDAVCAFLKSRGFRITEKRRASQRGYDIEARTADGRQKVAIEAKGETTTREGSDSYGKPFSSRTIYTCVTTAYFCASTYGPKGLLAGIAFPDNDAFRKQVAELLPSLARLEIELFWVGPAGRVSVAGHWSVWDGDC